MLCWMSVYGFTSSFSRRSDSFIFSYVPTISYNFLETFDIVDHPILGMLSPSDGEDQISR